MYIYKYKIVIKLFYINNIFIFVIWNNYNKGKANLLIPNKTFQMFLLKVLFEIYIGITHIVK